jgi:hypothetical protein
VSYIGNNLQVAYPSYANIDDISGSFDGVTTSFPLTVGGVAPVPAPLSSNQCLISVGGVVQRPDDSGSEGFLLSGGNIVFSAAPTGGDDFFGVILAGADYVNVGVNFPSGTASTPSITFDTDLDTGLFNSGANELGITTAGTSRLVVDSGGRLLVGTSSTSGITSIFAQGNSTNSAGAGVLGLGRGTGTISSGNQLGIIDFTDNAYNIYARIEGVADAATGAGDYPGRLVFSTTADGDPSPTERMRIAQNGVITAKGVYDFTTANAANVAVLSAGQLYRSTSSSKYKTDIETLQDSYADALLACRPVWYRSTCDSDCAEHSWWGFIAEEVAEIDPRLVHWKTVEVTYDEKGAPVQTPCDPEPEGVAYDRFVPHLLNLIKRQGEAIADLQAEVAALKAQ